MRMFVLAIILLHSYASAFLKNDKSVKIYKCCAENELVYSSFKFCRAPKVFRRLNFKGLSIYDDALEKTPKSVEDLKIEYSAFAVINETFEDISEYVILNFYLTEKGYLYREIPNEYNRFTKLGPKEFCVDYYMPPKNEWPNAKVPPEPTIRFWTKYEGNQTMDYKPVITWALMVSSVFLSLVLLVYCLLPDLRNLSGLVLMAYVASLLSSFLVLYTLQITIHKPEVCKGLSYALYFSLIASLCWMNIMSLDIWWTFRGYAKARPIHRRGERFKYGMYSLYAWGLPLVMTIFFIVIDNTNMRFWPWFVTPKIVDRACFLTAEPRTFYLYIPMLILTLCNWMFFLMTAFNIWRLHRETAALDTISDSTPQAHRKQRYRFMVYLRLSIIMGINWVLEVVSSFSPMFDGWYITDLYNVLIGVFIFVIFVCNKKKIRMLVKRYRSWKEHIARSKWSEWSNFGRRFSNSDSSSSSNSNSSSSSCNTTDFDITPATPLKIHVCADPKGPVFHKP